MLVDYRKWSPGLRSRQLNTLLTQQKRISREIGIYQTRQRGCERAGLAALAAVHATHLEYLKQRLQVVGSGIDLLRELQDHDPPAAEAGSNSAQVSAPIAG